MNRAAGQDEILTVDTIRNMNLIRKSQRCELMLWDNNDLWFYFILLQNQTKQTNKNKQTKACVWIHWLTLLLSYAKYIFISNQNEAKIWLKR